MLEYKLMDDIPLLVSTKWGSFSGITHFFTLRGGGVSKGEYSSLNLGLNSGDHIENVTSNRNRIKSLLGEVPDISFPNQCHGSEVIYLQQPEEHLICDALITDQKKLPIAVLSADCVPILLFDKKNSCIGVVHAGWRGTASGILKNTIMAMKKTFGTEPKRLQLLIGPCISKENYLVGADVLNAFSAIYLEEDIRKIFQPSQDRWSCDLAKANQLQAIHLGVSPENIEMPTFCTYSNDSFFSARRQGFQSGRQCALLMLN